MFDTLRVFTQNLVALDPFILHLLETFAWITVGAALAVSLVCVGFAVAHCCAPDHLSDVTAAVLLLASLACGSSRIGAQEATILTPPTQDVANLGSLTQESAIPEIDPGLERLWGRDSIRLSVNMCGVQCSNQISLSPNGRWILMQSFDPDGEFALWLASVESGEMVELTRGPSSGGRPRWFPDGGTIGFTSPEPGHEAWFSTLMRLPVSQQDGRPRGPARQVSLESAEPWAISPDGSRIAYVAIQSPEELLTGSVIRVIPSTGGNPIHSIPLRGTGMGIVMALRWDASGESLYCLTWPDINEEEVDVFRVLLQDGEPELVLASNDWVHLSPQARYLIRQLPSDGAEDHLFEVATLEGNPLARFRLPGPFELAGFGNRPGELLAVRQDIVNPLRVLPVAGGPVRRLNEAWGYDVPWAWTGDGSKIFFSTTLNGEDAYMLAPVDGRPMRQVPLPSDARQPRISRDGTLFFYVTEDASPPANSQERGFRDNLLLYDMEADRTLPVETPPGPFETRYLVGTEGPGAAGGLEAAEGEFAYVITRRGRHEVYLVDRYGGSTLGWSLPEEAWTPGDNAFGNIAIHGDRLVFAETAHLSDEDMGEEGTLYLARPGDPQAQPLLTLPGRLGPRGSNSVRWSPDGRLLTVSYHPPEREGPRGLLLVEIDESGELVGEPRIVSAEGGPDWLFGVQWMPDGQHFLALGGQEESGVDRDVWLLSLDPETPPVKLTSDLQEPIWYYRLSPDGRYITFDSEMPRGSSVWRVDLGEIPAGSGVNHARPA